MKSPTEPCPKCMKTNWRPIKQHSVILGYRCKECGNGVIWNLRYMYGQERERE